MDNVLDSVPHQMSAQACDDLDDVASAANSFAYLKCLTSDVKKNLQRKREFTLRGLMVA